MRSLRVSILAVFFAATAANAQTTGTQANPRGIETFRFGASVPVWDCSFTGVARDAAIDTVYVPRGAQFVYVNDAASADRALAVIQFLFWSDTSWQYRRLNVEIADPATLTTRASEPRSAATEQRYPTDRMRRRTFCIEKQIFDRTATRIYERWSWDFAAGILLLPIKLRGGGGRDFDFSKDVTLGTVAGPRWRIHRERELFVSALVGAGITAVTLDAENTRGVLTQATDRAAVTITTGVMVEMNRFQIGVMTGWDHISNPNQHDWEYQGHRWLSLGLGYTLLSAPPSQPATGKQGP